MAQFELDTAGSSQWSALDAFTQGYVEALFFTEEGEDNLGDKGFADLAPEALRDIVADCALFQSPEKADAILADCYMREDYSPVQAGRDFWFSRCGHGTGFWDRKQLEPDGFGDTLHGISADEFGNVDAYLGDDGRIYLA